MATVQPIDRFCRNHPDRDAIGVCRRCQEVVCSDCCTKVDGINYCLSCLSAEQKVSVLQPVADAAASQAVAWVILPALFGATMGVVLLAGWIMAHLTLL